MHRHIHTDIHPWDTHKLPDNARKYTLSRQWKRQVSSWHLYLLKHSPQRIPFTETKSWQWFQIVSIES